MPLETERPSVLHLPLPVCKTLYGFQHEKGSNHLQVRFPVHGDVGTFETADLHVLPLHQLEAVVHTNLFLPNVVW